MRLVKDFAFVIAARNARGGAFFEDDEIGVAAMLALADLKGDGAVREG